MQATPPPTPTPVIAQVPVIAGTPGGNATAVYEGFRHQRQELRDQLERLNDQRGELSGQLHDPMIGGVNRTGLEQRIAQADARIADVEKQIAASDAQVASAAAVPGAVVDPPPYRNPGPPDEVFVLTGIFFIVVLMPIAIAFARRIWKRSSAAITSLPKDIYDRFSRVEQSLDAIAIEVERVGENQRYLTRVLSERPQLGAGPAERIPVAERERQTESR
jgi:hypothetical protein